MLLRERPAKRRQPQWAMTHHGVKLLTAKARGESPKTKLVGRGAKTADHTHRRRCQHRHAPLRFAGIDVRQVHLNEWNRDTDKRIANRETGVRVGAGVDHSAVRISA